MNRTLLTLSSALTFFALVILATMDSAYASEKGAFWSGISAFTNAELRKRTAKNEEAGLLVDVYAGYVTNGWLFLGAAYDHDYEVVKTSGYVGTAVNKRTNYTRSSFGPTIGFIVEPIFFLYTYHLISKWDVKTQPIGGVDTTDVYRGTGQQLDLGVMIPLGPVHVGPQVSYKTFKYKKLHTTGAAEESLNPELIDIKLEPLLTVWAQF